MKDYKAQISILFASLVIVMIGFGIAIPLMPFYIVHYKASGSALGLMMALYSLMQFLFAPLWGRLSDRIGRKPVLLIGVAGYFLAFALQGIAQDVVQFTAARTLAGILSSATLPTAMAYVADITSVQDRSRGVGLMGAAMGVGMIIGPMLGGVLTKVSLALPEAVARLMQVTQDTTTGEMINLSIPFFASALLALVAIPFIVALLPETLTVEKRAALAATQIKKTRAKSLLEGLQGPAKFLFVMAFILAFALANMESVLALYGEQHFSMSPSEVGLLMGAMGLLSVIQQGFAIGPLTKRFGEEKVIQGGLCVSILGFLGMALSPTKWILIASAMIFNIGNVLLQPSVTSLVSRRARGGQGEVMGLNNSFQSLGRAIGPLWAGFAYDIYSTLSFWTGALIQILALIYSLRVFKSTEPIPEEIVSTSQAIPSVSKE